MLGRSKEIQSERMSYVEKDSYGVVKTMRRKTELE